MSQKLVFEITIQLTKYVLTHLFFLCSLLFFMVFSIYYAAVSLFFQIIRIISANLHFTQTYYVNVVMKDKKDGGYWLMHKLNQKRVHRRIKLVNCTMLQVEVFALHIYFLTYLCPAHRFERREQSVA